MPAANAANAKAIAGLVKTAAFGLVVAVSGAATWKNLVHDQEMDAIDKYYMNLNHTLATSARMDAKTHTHVGSLFK